MDDMFADSGDEGGVGNAAPAQPASAPAEGGAAAAGAPAVPGQSTSVPGQALSSTGDAALGGSNVEAPGGSASNATVPTAASTAVDYSSWPVAEMRRVLAEAGIALGGGALEKGHLAEKLHELDRVREAAAGCVPPGFVLDAKSGYFCNAETGWYYHAESRCFYKGGTWYTAEQHERSSA
jgi:OCRE domain